MQFCPGRSDATDGSGSEILEPRITGTTNDTIELLGDFVNVLGLTKRQYVAIVGGAYSGGAPLWSTETTDGSSTIDNTFFTNLIENEWTLTTDANGVELYKAEGEELYLLQADLIVRWDPEMLMAAQEFASDNATFRKEFASAWTQVMNADRFDGPFNNVCLSE
uniref:Plant heme peroxidase family profile domain-containing protein n=1 Tax=Lotharella globosa TaxID=91324 RepID=A0A7S3Z0B0_9EUKA